MANYQDSRGDGHTTKRQRTEGDHYGPPGRRDDGGYGGQRQSQYGFSNSRPGDDKPPNNVLLLTVLNPKYPISVDVMHTICSANGTVNRIVIFRKNGIQAMVEFDNVDDANRAKQALNGADIYSGCCTLRIEYAKPTRLNVYQNNQDSWDYTNPNPGGERSPGGPSRGKPLLAEPRFGSGPQPFGPPHDAPPHRGPPPPQQMDYHHPGRERTQYDQYGRPIDRYQPPPPERYDHYGPPANNGHGHYDSYAPSGPGSGYGDQMGGPPGMYQQGAVLMVYGLDKDRMNCKKVFNLFCLYGNVVRVKFLKSKEGVAMIQLGDKQACDIAMQNLNNINIFDSRMQLSFSKQAFLQDVPNPVSLADNTPSFLDFMGNRNNRFSNPEAAAKNRLSPPSRTLYFWNVPASITTEELGEIFSEQGVNPPSNSKKFPSKSEKSCSGLVEWETNTEAIEALAVGNHAEIPNPGGKFPFVLKLCFSNNNISR